VTIGVFPLLSRDGMPDRAMTLFRELRSQLDAAYDESGSIGRRYARMDEVGTPFCATVDHTTLQDDTITLRERDSTAQIRLPAGRLAETLRGLLDGRARFESLGPPLARD